MKIRSAHVSGYFYPSEKQAILDFLRQSLPESSPKKSAKAVMVPHAGYPYSGRTAVRTLAQTALTETVLLIGPNHSGVGSAFAVMAEGAWETPLGRTLIDEPLASRLLGCKRVRSDEEAHSMEHSLEVQIPILQFLAPSVRIVPVVVGTLDLPALREFGEFLGAELVKTGRPPLLVVSSDLNHYESQLATESKDRLALDAIASFDPERLALAVAEHGISMCGFGPMYAALYALKALGAGQSELVEHTTSAARTQDFDRVVGYAGLILN